MNVIDFEVALRTLYGECRGEPVESQKAVAHVLQNRVNAGSWGTNLTQVCLAHAQFSCWLQSDPNYKVITSVMDGYAGLEALRPILQAVVNGEPDPTNGATFYFAKNITPPYWAKNATFRGQFGNQLFYSNVGKAALAKEPIMTPQTTGTLQSAIQTLVIAACAALVAFGVMSHDTAEIAGAVLPGVLAAAWGVWTAWQNEAKTQAREAIAVQAGINSVPQAAGAPPRAAQPVTGLEAQTIIKGYTGR